MRGILELALAASASVRRAVTPAPTCATGLHMIAARGTTEAAGLGLMGIVVRNVTLRLPGSDYEAVNYPATFSDYTGSEAAGVEAFTTMIEEYTKLCPDTPIALLGYSQGAQALMDAICGTSEVGFDVSPDLSDAFEKHVVAAITFGDPTHVVGAPWNRGTSENDGFFPRTNITACEPYSDVIRGWCDTGDVYCDTGEDRLVHSSYFLKYTDDAADFIIENYSKAVESAATSSSSAPASSSTVSSAVSSAAAATTTTTTTAPATSATSGSTVSPTGPPEATGNAVLAGSSAAVAVACLALSVFGLAL
ncbi:cutinase-domain-containing protein [Apodospora peruviana]|uniref:Cutinase-domain-containing protein n=1 Tax=Apodospora peruviana TaxID=516989 RepID=A0AAE0LY63_9PEZI|nr:cutinase-domain-containing protein [Apodospora peruviana]